MCNKLKLKIKSVSPCGVRHGFVPCGKCMDCRNHIKSEWVFRLRVELDKLCAKGWKIGFFTLTYNKQHLPYLPAKLIEGEYKRIECFKKDDVRTFIVKLKNWLKKEYAAVKRYKYHRVKGKVVSRELLFDDAPRFMICSERGEHTQRSHYHGIICFPPKVPAKPLFDKILELWRGEIYPDGKNCKGFGWVFPKKFDGGVDSHGYNHKPFLCDSTKAAALYAAKYVCKDLAYLDYIKDFSLRKSYKFYHRFVEKIVEKRWDGQLFDPCDIGDTIDFEVERSVRVGDCVHELKLSDYMPFHFQSKSIGLSFLDGLTDAQKLSYLQDGYGFVGENSPSTLPVYIKNKILFVPDYQFDNKGKRLVRRKRTAFFREHYKEVFEAKREQIKKQFDQLLDQNTWRSVGASNRDIEYVTSVKEFCEIDSLTLSNWYLAYYGVRYDECYELPFAAQWYRRYDACFIDSVDFSGVLILKGVYDFLTAFITNLFELWIKYDVNLNEKKMFDYREVNRINDYWKSQS